METTELNEYAPPTVPRGRPHPIPEGIAGVRAMIRCTVREDQAAFIALCGLVGLRAGESLTCVPSAFHLHDMELTVRGKGDKTRVVPVSPEAWDVLAIPFTRTMCDRGPSAPIVSMKDRSARKLVTDTAIRADLRRHVTSHDLRATFATEVYDRTRDLRLVQELLGHSSPNTTQLYVNVAREKLRQAVIL